MAKCDIKLTALGKQLNTNVLKQKLLLEQLTCTMLVLGS